MRKYPERFPRDSESSVSESDDIQCLQSKGKIMLIQKTDRIMYASPPSKKSTKEGGLEYRVAETA